MDERDRSNIRQLFAELDAFLALQFERGLGRAEPGAVEAAYDALLALLERRRGEGGPLAARWDRWLGSLRGTAVSLFGFPALQPDRIPADAPDAYLDEQRGRLLGSAAAEAVLSRLSRDYERLFAAPFFERIRACGDGWLERSDARLGAPLDPRPLADLLFRLDGRPGLSAQVELEFHELRAEPPRFFAARLSSRRRCLIAHAPADTLFRLSLLCHEIGHASTTDPCETLEERFLDDRPGAEEDQEVDSYRYERLLAENLPAILADRAPGGAGELLLARKALQGFQHALACDLNRRFFAGEPLPAIQARCEELTRRRLPLRAAAGWLSAADLGRPLSRLPYVRAVEAVFL